MDEMDKGAKVEAAKRIMSAEGSEGEHGWHSWRCFDKERYPGECDCTERVAQELVEALCAQAWDEAAQEAHDSGWMQMYGLQDTKERNPYRAQPEEDSPVDEEEEGR